MKLRNLLLTATLLLTIGAASAFAVEPETEQALTETTYTMSTTTTGGYYYATAGNNTLTVTLLQYSGNANTTDGWTYFAVGYKADGTTQTFEQALTLDNTNITGRELTATEIAGLTTYRAPDSEGLHAYEFTVSFDAETTEKIGFAGRNGSDNKLVYSPVNAAPSNDFHFSDKDTNSILFFGKKEFKNGNLKAQIMSGAAFVDSGNGGAPVGSPLPAPVVTLLIALGFGAALVMYRNRKQEIA